MKKILLNASIKDHAEKQDEIVSNNDIAVIGMACRFSDAENTNKFWQKIRNGEDFISKIPLQRYKDIIHYLKFNKKEYNAVEIAEMAYLNEIAEFDCNFFQLSPNEASLMDPNQRVFLQVLWEAIEDAGVMDTIQGSDTSVFVGYSGGSMYEQLITQVHTESLPMSVTGNLNAIIASRIQYILNLTGPSVLLDTACSSSLTAIYLACQEIRNGKCGMALVGSINLNLLPLKNKSELGLESSSGRTRAFDYDADGIGSGEGAGVVLLKPLYQAVRDGDNIYAVIKGCAINQDGSSNGITAPNPRAQRNVILNAWKDADIDPESISYIEAHGTGTKLGDPIEVEGINAAFRQYTDKRQFCAIGSVKSNIGHLNHAAGIAGFIKAVLILKYKEIPPLLHFERPNRNVSFVRSPLYINDTLTSIADIAYPIRCGVSSFGLSGTNCHIILEEPPIRNQTICEEGSPQLFTLSAATNQSLFHFIDKFLIYIKHNKNLRLQDICYTMNTGRLRYQYRIAFIVRDPTELEKKLAHAYTLCGKCMYNEKTELTADEIYYSQSPVSPYNENVSACDETEKKTSEDATEAVFDKAASPTVSDELLLKICNKYITGNKIDWNILYEKRACKKISLPTYAFDNKRSWIDIPGAWDSGLYHSTRWIENPPDHTSSSTTERENVIILTHPDSKSDRFISDLKKKNMQVYEVNLGQTYEKVSDDKYIVDGTTADYIRLLNHFNQNKQLYFIHMLTIETDDSRNRFEQLNGNLNNGVYSLFNIVKAIHNNKMEQVNMLLISRYANKVDSNNDVRPENAAFLSLGKVISVESNRIKCKSTDIDYMTSNDAIIHEILRFDDHCLVAYRDNKRYIEILDETDISKIRENKVEILENGVYIISGGSGGIGLEIAKYLSSRKNVQIYLLAKSEIPERRQWKKVLRNLKGSKAFRIVSAITEIEQRGSQVDYFCVDISDFSAMKRTFDKIRETHQKINGVIHSAGKVGEGALLTVKQGMFKQAVNTKILGAWILNDLTKNNDLDFFISFSSLTCLSAVEGHGAYTVGNAYLDAFAAYKRENCKRIITVNWSAWKETGMAVDYNLQDTGFFKMLTTSLALCAFERVLQKDVSQIIIGEIDYAKADKYTKRYEDIALSQASVHMLSSVSGNSQQETTGQLSMVRDGIKSLTGEEKEKFNNYEEMIAYVWLSVLGYDNLTMDDNYFDLGGDSIHAIRIVNMIYELVNKKLEINEILEHPTVSGLARHMEENYTLPIEASVAIERAEIKPYYFVSPAQKSLFILNMMDEQSTNYNMPHAFVIKGVLDAEQFQDSIRLLIEKHESLRTSFHLNDGLPMQKIHDSIVPDFNYLEGTKKDVDGLLLSFIKPFDISMAPLFRVCLFKTSENEHYVLIDMHHIISDGASMDILLQDLASIYEERHFYPLNLQYKDFSEWQHKRMQSYMMKKQESYWLDMFSGDIPILDLSTDYPRPLVQSHRGDTFNFTFDKQLYRDMKNFTAKTKTTPYMVLLSSFFILLSKYSRQEDIVIGTPVTARNSNDLEKIIGMFVNTLAVRGAPCGDKRFIDFLNEIKETVLRLFQNQEYPFEEFVQRLGIQRDLSRHPLFEVVFVYQKINNNLELPKELRFNPYRISNYETKFSLTFEVFEHDEEIKLAIHYCTDLFCNQSISNFAKCYTNIVGIVIRQSEILIKDVELLSVNDQESILCSSECNTVTYPSEKTIHELFEKSALAWPNHIAIVFEGEYITYQNLNMRANKLGIFLRESGVVPNSIVAVMAKKTSDIIVAVLGILKAGGAYLPIDPDYPNNRIEYMLRNSNTKILLTQEEYRNKIDFPKTQFIIGLEQKIEDTNERITPINKSSDMAYILYTSGTSGKPKAAIIEHRNVVRLLFNDKMQFAFSSSDVWSMFHSFCFDFSVWEMYGALLYGGTLVIVPKHIAKSPDLYAQLLEEHKVTVLNQTPSAFYNLIEADARLDKKLSSIRYVIFGGEELKPSKLSGWHEKYPDHQIVNMYGITETTVHVTYKEIGKNEINAGISNIGGAIPTTAVYLFDSNMKLLPHGIPGELCVAGEGVGRGYLNNPSLTMDKFVPNPYKESEIIYRSGDLAKQLPNGELEYLGRIDNQVKVRGYRIELGEIELHLLKHELIKEAVVVFKNVIQSDKSICAYLVAEKEISVSNLRTYLSHFLPEYMIPAYFVFVDRMPLTGNGKTDVRQLPDPKKQINTGTLYQPPANDLENNLLYIWKKVLQLESVGMDDNFFDLGGNSMLLLLLQKEIEKEYPQIVKVIDLFTNSTIKKLAQFIQGFRQTDEIGAGTGGKQNSMDGLKNVFQNLKSGEIDTDEALEQIRALKG